MAGTRGSPPRERGGGPDPAMTTRALSSPAVDCRFLLLRMQNELLHAPVQNLGNVEVVLGWACDLVDPAELLELLARFPEIAEHLAVEAQLVDAAGIGIGAVEHLVGTGSDAQRPRGTGREASSGLQIRGQIRLVADRW